MSSVLPCFVPIVFIAGHILEVLKNAQLSLRTEARAPGVFCLD